MTAPPLSRILLIDDDPDIGEIVKLALEGVGGYTVEVCRRGEEAVEAASAFTPGLILLDVMMAGMDGPATLQALHEAAETAAVPVVLMTAKTLPSEIRQFREMGAVDVIPKPFDPMTLAETVSSIWTRYHGE